MDAVSHEPLMAWLFIRRYFMRIVIGLVLAAAVSIAVFVWMPYQREQRIARKIGGAVHWEYRGPTWVPRSIQDSLTFFGRIDWVHPTIDDVRSGVFLELGSLTNLSMLNLTQTEITDVGLEHVNRMKSLELLDLSDTKVTGTGLIHLNGLTNLKWLYLSQTPVVDRGLVHLKGLASVKEVNLSETQITDAGLEHLKGMTRLQRVHLENTQTTQEGRAMLRKALPGCTIYPDP